MKIGRCATFFCFLSQAKNRQTKIYILFTGFNKLHRINQNELNKNKIQFLEFIHAIHNTHTQHRNTVDFIANYRFTGDVFHETTIFHPWGHSLKTEQNLPKLPHHRPKNSYIPTPLYRTPPSLSSLSKLIKLSV